MDEKNLNKFDSFNCLKRISMIVEVVIYEENF